MCQRDLSSVFTPPRPDRVVYFRGKLSQSRLDETSGKRKKEKKKGKIAFQKCCWKADGSQKSREKENILRAEKCPGNVRGSRPKLLESESNKKAGLRFSFLALISSIKIKTFWIMFCVFFCYYLRRVCYSSCSTTWKKKKKKCARLGWNPAGSYCFHSLGWEAR